MKWFSQLLIQQGSTSVTTSASPCSSADGMRATLVVTADFEKGSPTTLIAAQRRTDIMPVPNVDG